MDKDITDEVEFDLNDDELLPFTRCACGLAFKPWNLVIGMERDYPKVCPNCKRELYFTISIRVFEKEKQ